MTFASIHPFPERDCKLVHERRFVLDVRVRLLECFEDIEDVYGIGLEERHHSDGGSSRQAVLLTRLMLDEKSALNFPDNPDGERVTVRSVQIAAPVISPAGLGAPSSIGGQFRQPVIPSSGVGVHGDGVKPSCMLFIEIRP